MWSDARQVLLQVQVSQRVASQPQLALAGAQLQLAG
jgi:hypothetical protein